MTAAPRHPDLHELVDQLNPAQTDALRAVVLQLVTPPAETTETIETLPRRLSFAGTLSASQTSPHARMKSSTRSSATAPAELLMLLADTGPLVAVANDRDQHHERCQTLAARTPR